MKMNLANKLTVFRMILVPVIALIPVIHSIVKIPQTKYKTLLKLFYFSLSYFPPNKQIVIC